MEIMQKNIKMLRDTNEEYACCLGCGIKIKNEETEDSSCFECKKCEKERELMEDNSRLIKILQNQRNKLNRKIATLKKETLN